MGVDLFGPFGTAPAVVEDEAFTFLQGEELLHPDAEQVSERPRWPPSRT